MRTFNEYVICHACHRPLLHPPHPTASGAPFCEPCYLSLRIAELRCALSAYKDYITDSHRDKLQGIATDYKQSSQDETPL